MRAFAIFISLLVSVGGWSSACGEPTIPSESAKGGERSSARLDATSALADAPPVQTGWRVRLLRAAEHALVPGGWRAPSEAAERLEPSPWPVDLAAVPTTPVRVFDCRERICVAMFVRKRALAEVATRRVVVDVGASGSGRVEVARGTRFSVDGKRDERRRWRGVDFDVDAVKVEGGRVPGDAVGRLYRPQAFSEGDDDALVVSDTRVRDEPGGRVIASLEPDPCVGVEQLAGDDGAWVEVLVHEPSVRVRGWVRREGLVRQGGCLGDVTEGGGGRTGYSPPYAEIPAGTWLSAEPDGPRVARTVGEATVSCLTEVRSGWRRVAIESVWGAIPVWLPPEMAETCSAG